MHRFIQRLAWRILFALGAGVGIVLCIVIAPGGAQTARAQAPTAVSIVDFAFQPATVTVPVGGTVTWTNTGNAPHTSTSTTGAWDSGRLTTGQSFSFTFQQAGSFAYICTIHPQMMGTVVVQGAVAAPP
ncbi:MAG: cupredoxin domain-containing protein, partial [Dehalococcoidia bacterium]